MGERRYDPEGTREAIVAAALRIFVDQGVAAASMSQIATAAGVTKSLIHHHFGSKAELWHAVKEQGMSNYFGAMLDIIRAESQGDEPLRRAVEVTFQWHRDHPEVVRLMAWAFLDSDDKPHPPACVGPQVSEEGMARIRRAQKEGAIRADVDPIWVQASFFLLGTAFFQMRWLYASWDAQCCGNDPTTLDERYLRDMMKIFFEGVLPRTRGPERD